MIWQVLFAAFELAVPVGAVMGGVALALRGRKRAGWVWALSLVTAWVCSLIWLVTDALDEGASVRWFVWVGALAVQALGMGSLAWQVRHAYISGLSEDP